MSPIETPSPAAGKPGPDPGLSAADILGWVNQVIAATADLPDLGLCAAERMVLSGSLSTEAPRLVTLTAEALIEDHQLFDDIPVDPQHLQLRQARATAFRQLHTALLLFAGRARDCYLHEQSLAVQDAMNVIRQVRSDTERPFPHPRHEERAMAISPAEDLLTRRKERKKRVARRRKDAAAAAPPDPPPPPGKKPLTPQEAAMKELGRKRAAALVDDYMRNSSANAAAAAAESLHTVSTGSTPSAERAETANLPACLIEKDRVANEGSSYPGSTGSTGPQRRRQVKQQE